MAEIIVALMALLTIGFAGTRLASLVRLPHSVFLVIVGIVGGLLLRSEDPKLSHELAHWFPEIILLILLPPLIFESAYNLNIRDLRKDIAPIGAMAVISLILSTFVVGYALHLAFGLKLLPALTFGALISATDPVAVVALFKEIGAPKRLNVLVEGESLLNDGTAIVLFRVLMAAALAPQVGAGMITDGILNFFQVAIGGIFVGLWVALLVSFLLKLTSGSAASQLGLTVAAAYVSFLVADHFLHVSGVIATMVVGLFLGSRARLEFNKEALHGMHYIWEFLALAANTIVFFAVGVTVDPHVLGQSLPYMPATLAIVYLARAFAVGSIVPIVNKLKLAQPVSFAYQIVLVWGGLRGGLALGLVLMLPDSFPHKQLFLALATYVVGATLFVNALSIRKLMSWLKLDVLDPVDQGFYGKTLRVVQEAVFGPLEKAAASGGISKTLVSRQKEIFSAQLPQASENPEIEVRFAVNRLILAERHYYDERLEDGVLSQAAYIRLVQMVESRLATYQAHGMEGLQTAGLPFPQETLVERLEQKFLSGGSGEVKRLTTQLETLLHLKFGLEEAAHHVESDLPEIALLTSLWRNQAQKALDHFYRLYPRHGSAVQSHFIANAVSASSESQAQSLYGSSVIGGTVFARAMETIDHAFEKAADEAERMLNPSAEFLLARVPLFAGLPAEAIHALARGANRKSIPKGKEVVREGDPGRSLYVVTGGILEVRLSKSPARPRLFSGDCFGEMSLLLNQPRSATVVAEVTSELVEIFPEALQPLFDSFPDLKARVEQIVVERKKAA